MQEAYTKRAVGGASIAFVFSILAAGVAYVTRIILARSLGPTEYGLFSSIMTFIVFFLFFRNLGLSEALSKFIAEFKVSGKYDEIKTVIVSVFTFQLLGSLIFVTVFFFLADFLANSYFQTPRAGLYFKVFLLYIIFSIFFTVLKGIFRGYQKMFLFSSVELVKNSIMLILLLIFFKLGLEIFAAILSYVLVGPLLFLIYSFFAFRVSHFFKSKVVNFKKISKKVILFGVPLFAASFAGKIIGYIDTIILTHFRPLSEVGVYNVVLPTALILLMFGRAVSAITFPLSSELWAKRDIARLSEGLRMIHKYSFVITIPVIFTLFSFAKFFIVLFFGADYQSGETAFQILLVGMLIFVVAMINNNILSAIGKPKVVAQIVIFSAAINVILNLILIPIFGINGAAFATAVSYGCNLMLSMKSVSKYIKLKSDYFNWFKQGIAGLLFVLVISFLKDNVLLGVWWQLIISILAGMIVYTLALFIFKIVDLNEIKYYVRLVRK